MAVQLPNNYLVDLHEGGTRYFIPIQSIDTVSFFLNTPEPLTYTGFDDLVLSTFDLAGNEITANIATLSKIDLSGGGYRIYCEDIALVNEEQDGVYFFAIYNSNDNSVFQVLNVFEAIGIDQLDSYIRVEYRHSTNIFNFNYEELPLFYNKIYLEINEINRVGEYEKDIYQERTTGYIRPRKNIYREVVTLESYQFDYPFNSAMRALSMHDDILINGNPYQIKSGYEAPQQKAHRKSNGIVEMYDQIANEINLNG